MPHKKNHSVEFHYHFKSRNYKNSFGRNSNNTWNELPDKTRSKLREIVEKRDGLVCSQKYGYGCGRSNIEQLTMDHIIPVRAGGPVCDMNNLQLLCEKCHNRKTMEIDIQYTSLYQRRIH
jgi:5-methylcytosine-specific restriction endonuclease McrA